MGPKGYEEAFHKKMPMDLNKTKKYKNMKTRVINEKQLRKIVAESIKKVLRESEENLPSPEEWSTYDISDKKDTLEKLGCPVYDIPNMLRHENGYFDEDDCAEEYNEVLDNWYEEEYKDHMKRKHQPFRFI